MHFQTVINTYSIFNGITLEIVLRVLTQKSDSTSRS